MITTVTEKCRPENLPFHGLFRVLNNRDFSLLPPSLFLSPIFPRNDSWSVARDPTNEYKSDSGLEDLFFFFFSSNRTDDIYFSSSSCTHNPPPSSSSFLYPLFPPSSSLYIFLMEFHFLRVLKTSAKRRCEKKLENMCLPYNKTPSR